MAPDEGTTEFVVAVWIYELGNSLGADGEPIVGSIGYDLDGACTELFDSTTCVAPDWAADHPDYPGGRDNAMGRVLYELHRNTKSDPAPVDATAASNGRSRDGVATTVIRVRGYNQGEDDARIDVEVFAATLLDEGGPRPNPPRWDGRDAWHPLEPWLEPAPDGGGDLGAGRSRARYSSSDAFVTGGLLVARFAELPFATGVLSRVVITAKVSAGIGGRWVLHEGIVAGRHDADDLLTTLEAPRRPGGDPRCVGSADYEEAKAILCSFADINFNGTDDGSAPCDALSWAFRFQAEPAALSDEVRPMSIIDDPDLKRCPEAISPARDRCAPP